MSSPRTTSLRDVHEVLSILERNEERSRHVINMVPSENSTSPLVKLPLLLDVYHRYFFNDAESPSDWNFRGSEVVAALETKLTLPLLRELTGAMHVNLRPLSGLSGMTLILSALGGPPGSTVMTVAPEQGGHYATESIARRLGLSVCFMTGTDAHTVDFDQVRGLIRSKRPGLVYVDQSNCLFPLDVAALVGAVRSETSETLIHVDASHWMGLVLGGCVPNPLTVGADSFGGSTHKTFPGPQKAVFATNRQDLAERVKATQYFMISSHHFAAAIGLGIALLEFAECGGQEYARSVVENTRELGRLLAANGLDVVAADRGYSGGHQLWLRTSHIGSDSMEVSDRLYAAGLRVNAFPELPGLQEPVLRIGVNEATYHGLCSEDMPELAEVFASAAQGTASPRDLRRRVAALRARYHLPYSFVSRDPEVVARALALAAHSYSDSREASELAVTASGASAKKPLYEPGTVAE